MKIALGSDERTHLTGFLMAELERLGHQVALVGPLAGDDIEWADVAAQLIASGRWRDVDVE